MWIAACALGILATAQDGLTAESLVDEGWKLIPAFSGATVESLEVGQRPRAAAAAHVFRAAIELEPQHWRALWSLGHVETMLAADLASRELEGAEERVEAARDALLGAVALAPEDPWARYLLGTLEVTLGAPAEAVDEFESMLARLRARASEGTAGESDPWLRFKALEWRPEALMRSGEFDAARDAMRTFHGEFSTNAFPLRVALAESHLRQRDLAAARGEFEAIVEAFPTDFQAYATLGYIAGLLRDDAMATERLSTALQYEPRPGLYLRLWLWILATEEARPAAEGDLREFLEFAPSDVPEWDLRLGRFCIGDGAPDEFIAAARTERERRLDAGEAVDELLSEAWFYVGQRYERDARAAEDADALLTEARLAYRSALEARPTAWKWEWAFARLHYADLAAAAGLPLVALPPSGARALAVHMAGEAAPRPAGEGPFAPGAALLMLVDDGRGGLRYAAVPVLEN